MGKRILFIDRDGTLIKEAPPAYQVDAWDKLEFYPEAFFYMRKMRRNLILADHDHQPGMG